MRRLPRFVGVVLLGIFCHAVMSQEPIRKITISETADDTEALRREAIDKTQQRIWQTKVTYQCNQLPLSNAMNGLAEKANCRIHIARSELVSPDTPVTIDVKDVSLHSTLVMMLRPHKLGYLPAEDEIVITDRKTALEFVTVKFYDTTLLQPEGQGPDPSVGYHAYLLESMFDSYWYELGLEGNGRMNGFRSTLIVWQMPEVHWEIEQLLPQLTKAKQLPTEGYSGEALKVSPPIDQVEAITAKLHAAKIRGQLSNVTLAEVLATIEQAVHIPVCAQHEALERTLLPASEGKLSIRWSDCTAWEALDQFTTIYEAGWQIVDDRIEITSPGRSHTKSVVRVYPVRDLIWYGMKFSPENQKRVEAITSAYHLFVDETNVSSPSPVFDAEHPALPDYDSLINQIYELYPEDWEGDNAIESFEWADCLVISTPPYWHEKIEAHLNHLRQSRPTINPDEFLLYVEKLESEVVTIPFKVGKDDQGKNLLSADELHHIAQQVQADIAPDSWKKEDAYIIATNQKLLVRNRRDILQRAADVLGEVWGLENPFRPWR